MLLVEVLLLGRGVGKRVCPSSKLEEQLVEFGNFRDQFRPFGGVSVIFWGFHMLSGFISRSPGPGRALNPLEGDRRSARNSWSGSEIRQESSYAIFDRYFHLKVCGCVGWIVIYLT